MQQIIKNEFRVTFANDAKHHNAFTPGAKRHLVRESRRAERRIGRLLASEGLETFLEDVMRGCDCALCSLETLQAEMQYEG